MPIVRQLYQTLNWILHYGPVFCRTDPLSRPLHLETLVLNLSTARLSQGPASLPEKAGRNGVDKYQPIHHLVKLLQGSGVLTGYVDLIQLVDDDSRTTDIVTRSGENPGVPAYWDRYGFEWGLEATQQIRLDSEII